MTDESGSTDAFEQRCNMDRSDRMQKAKQLLQNSKKLSLTPDELAYQAVELASLMLEEAHATQTHAEKEIQTQLARMMNDPSGKIFTTSMTDQCFRTKNSARVADQMIYLLNKYGLPQFVNAGKKFQLWIFKHLGKVFPNILVPLAKQRLRKETARVILPGEVKPLKEHIEKRRMEGVQVNLNHLGEAILGEEEAKKRLEIYLKDLSNPDFEYISVKISTIFSQINLLAWQNTVETLVDRLKSLYRTAQRHYYQRPNGQKVQKFVYLDMEEYRDLPLTVEAFQRTLDDVKFKHYSAGIVLQAYIPDAYSIQQELTAWAKKRVADGGAPIKIRIVKGANLAMELVESSLKEWPQAPYPTKIEVDANYKRMVFYGTTKENASAVSLGIGSHNLFDIAYAMLLRAKNDGEDVISFEMLEGMADHIRRVVQQLTGSVLLYCPTATREEFQNAIAYLIRRLDENTAPENFLRHLFGMHPNSKEWKEQAHLFIESCKLIPSVSSTPRRTQNRNLEVNLQPSSMRERFKNEADTDWTRPQNRIWAEESLKKWSKGHFERIPLSINGKEIFTERMADGRDPSLPEAVLYQYSLAEKDHLTQVIKSAKANEYSWASTPLEERIKLLGDIAVILRENRGELIGAMVANTGKTVFEADVEVSEAIDFAEYYRRNVFELLTLLQDVKWTPKGTVLVAPPWNFPCSIPAGGILAALATGNCVIFKPPAEAVLVGWTLVQLFWKAGVSKQVLQFITCEDEPIGSQLIQDPRINMVVLTGSTDTAKLFLRLRPGIDLAAETGGKNAMIITRLSDRDLAVKDLIQSAFGHAGQKCSACSLAICEEEVYEDSQFRAQLRDAAASLFVGSQWNLKTRVNPLINRPGEVLLKGLTTLEEGEEWLLEPKQDKNNPQLWSPGIKLGVKPNSFSYRNELFGPVLSVMKAKNLDEAIQLANGTIYGLTSGLHSLDEREHQRWIDAIEAGNCYINRGVTGAIVQRQPFGGCKQSSFGFGMKAGGPNYLTQFMHARQFIVPQTPISCVIPPAIISLGELLEESQRTIWNATIQNYLFFWKYYFSQSHDNSHVYGEDNLLSYVPHKKVVLRVQEEDSFLDVLRAIAGAVICGTMFEVSGERTPLMGILSTAECLPKIPKVKIVKETESQFVARIKKGGVNRIRFFSPASDSLKRACAEAACNLIVAPILANGRIELLNHLREVSLSNDYHRYGNLGEREFENDKVQDCKSCCQVQCCGGCE